MEGRGSGSREAIAWWGAVGADMVRGDFGAVDAATAGVRTRASAGEPVPADWLCLAWTAIAAVAGLRGNPVCSEAGFEEAMRHARRAEDPRSEPLVRIARAECTANEQPARAIDDCRRVLGCSRELSPSILHQARFALIGGHRASGDLAIALAIGDRLLQAELTPLERARALAGHAVTLLAAEQPAPALLALDESAQLFAQEGALFFAASTESTLARLVPERRTELYERAAARAGEHIDDPAWRRILDLPYPLLAAPPTVVPSARELVVALVARGFTSRQVADALLIRPSTVESHVRRSMELSGATSRAQIVGARGPEAEAQWLSLSPHERELLELVAGGCTTKAISQRLHLSSRTVTRRLRTLRERFGVANTPALVAAAASGPVGGESPGA